MGPYHKEMKSIKDVSKYFKKDEKSSALIFTGKTLEVRIPYNFKKYGSLTITDVVTTIGVCDLIFDDEYQVGLNILANITIEPSDIRQMTYKGIVYLVLTLKEGDKFMSSYRVVQDSYIVYVLWSEFITDGRVGYWIKYDDLLKIFRNVVALTGSGIGVSQSVFSGIIGHLARDSRNTSLQYRLTDMKRPMRLVALNSISMASSSTIARLNGSYFRDAGITSALRYEVDQQQPFENILRGISSAQLDENNSNAII